MRTWLNAPAPILWPTLYLWWTGCLLKSFHGWLLFDGSESGMEDPPPMMVYLLGSICCIYVGNEVRD